jgi:hypothetical protein
MRRTSSPVKPSPPGHVSPHSRRWTHREGQAEEALPEWVATVEFEAQRASEIGGSPRDSEARSATSPSLQRYSISRKYVGSPVSPEPISVMQVGPSEEHDEESNEQDEATNPLVSKCKCWRRRTTCIRTSSPDSLGRI